MTIGERERLARVAKGLTHAELAELVGVSKGYISQLEATEQSGRARIQEPSIEKTRAFAVALGVPFEWLAFGEGPEPEWPTATDGSAAE